MEEKEEMVEGILATLGDFGLRDQVEILGNVFLRLGVDEMERASAISIGELTAHNIVEKVAEDVRENGETLGNALARQGLTILMWLRAI
jgi:hypothetical protein